MNKFEHPPQSFEEKNKKEEGEKEENIESKESPENKKEQKEKQEKSGGFFSKAKMIGKTAYSVISSIGGVKFIGDLGLALAKKGDIYNHFKQRGEVKEERKEISHALEEIIIIAKQRKEIKAEMDEASDKRTKIWKSSHEKWEEDRKNLQNAVKNFKEKINNAKSLPDKEKKELKKQLSLIIKERDAKIENAEEWRNKKTNEVLGTYLQTKVKGTRIARDALNTAFTASGLLALRGAVYGGVALVERAKKANLEFSKKELKESLRSKELLDLDRKINSLEEDLEAETSDEKSKKIKEQLDELKSEREEFFEEHFEKGPNSRLAHIIKDTTVNATVETVRSLVFQGKSKESEHKFRDFVKSLGTVLRGFGIGSAAVNEIVNQGVSGAFEEANDSFLDAFEENGAMGVLGETKDNFAERFKSMIGIFGGKEVEAELEGVEREVQHETQTFESGFDNQDEVITNSDLQATAESEATPEDVSPSIEADTNTSVVDSAEETDSMGRPSVDKPDVSEIYPAKSFEELDIGHADYQGGSSIWDEIDNQIDSRAGILKTLQALGDKTEASETHLIDYLKDQIVENSEEFGLPEGIDPDEVTAEQLKNTDWDKLFESIKTKEGFTKAFSNLSESAKQNIIENNKILREVSQRTGEPIDSEHVDQTLSDVKEAGGVDEYFKTTNQDLPIKETLTPSSGEEVEDVVNLEDKDLGYMDDEERSLLHHIKQYRGEHELPAHVADNAQEEAAEMIIANATQEQINQYPDVQDAFKEIYINKLRESLDTGFLGIFGGPDPDELSEEIAGLARATGDLSKEEAGVFTQFIAQGEEMDKDVVDQFIEDGYWNEDVFVGEVENFSQELSESGLPHGQEFIPRYLHLGGDESELGLVHAIDDKKGVYEYVLEDGQKIKVTKDRLQQILSEESTKETIPSQGGEGGVEVKVESKSGQEPSQTTEVKDEAKPEESPSENVKESKKVSEKTEQSAKPEKAEEVKKQPETQPDKPKTKANQPAEEKPEEPTPKQENISESTTEIKEDELPEEVQGTVTKYEELVDNSDDYQDLEVNSGQADDYNYYTLNLTKSDGSHVVGYFNEAGERIEDGLVVQFIKQDISPESEAAKKILK
ncbi:MAG TPA: hypothetical protein VKO61_01895, partial [Candidatus Paceibacterota bacterium]|nr:hypothetical protein [Candidatus Paceibacterota bacterium]